MLILQPLTASMSILPETSVDLRVMVFMMSGARSVGRSCLEPHRMNMAFAGPRRFVILAETKVSLAKIAAKVSPH
ncbi:hypothetical protein BDZ89DRAFT_1226566 [Hymenopellis radicata]|nr:hypothetical protein BDZ89DRAFT_1226566 [Hymenopellis radicata]